MENFGGTLAVPRLSVATVSEDQTIWVMDWNSGDKVQAPVYLLEPREDRESLATEDIIHRIGVWARGGNSYAMWWLAWWFEGANHPKSVWYYVAALRANPSGHGWAHDRIRSDAQYPIMCKDVPAPDLVFLDGIPEINRLAIGQDWAEAVRMAEAAVHLPSSQEHTHTGA